MKNRFNRILLGLIVFSFFTQGCKNVSEDQKIEEHLLKFEIAKGDYEFGVPIGMSILNNNLLINDFYGDTLVHCVDMDTWTTTRKIVSKGMGPGEVLAPIELIVTDDSISVFSRPTMMMFKSSGCDLSTLTNVAIMPSVVSRIFQMGDNEYIASIVTLGNDPQYGNARFILLNSAGEVQYSFGEYPRIWSDEKDMPTDVLANFHQIRGFCKLDSDSFAVVSSHVLSIYAKNQEGQYSLVAEKMMMPYEYDYNLSDGMATAQGRLKEGFPKCADGVAKLGDDLIVTFNMNELPARNQNVDFLRYDNELSLKAIYHPATAVRAPFIISDDGSIIAFDDENDEFEIAISTPLD